MNRSSARAALASFAGVALVYLVVSLLENQLALRFVDTLPFVRDRSDLMWVASLAALAALYGILVIAQNAYADHPAQQWRGWLKLALEIVTGLGSAFSAMVGNSITIPLRVDQVIDAHKPWSVWALIAFLAFLIAAVPIIRHLFDVYKWWGKREAKPFLEQNVSDWEEHLADPLLRADQRCDLPIEDWPEALQPIPLAPTSQPVPLAKQDMYDDKLKEEAANQRATAVKLHEILSDQPKGVAPVVQLLLTGGPGGGKSAQLYLLAWRAAKAALEILLPAHSAEHGFISFLRRQLKRLQFWSYEPEVSEVPLLPVILDLSTWRFRKGDKKSMENWIVDETSRKYNVHREAVRSWMKGGSLFVLLDGLDGLRAPKREYTSQFPRKPGLSPRHDCVEAINDYLRAHPTCSLVVCCRTDEYRAVMEPEHSRVQLMLRTAVRLGLVDPDEVRDKLQQGVGAMIPDDLLRVLRVPLLLSVAQLQAQENIATLRAIPPELRTAEILTDVLLANYVAWVLRGRDRGEINDMKDAMAWLGHVMVKNSDALVFQVPGLQPWMIPTPDGQENVKRIIKRIKFVVQAMAVLVLGTVVATVALKVYSLHGLEIFGPDVSSGTLVITVLIVTLLGSVGYFLGVDWPIDRPTNDMRQWHESLMTDTHRGFRAWLRALITGAGASDRSRLDTLVIRTGGSSRQMFIIGVMITAFVGAVGWLSGGTVRSLAEGLIFGVGIAGVVSAVLGPSGGILGPRRDLHHPEAAVYTALRQALRILLFYVLIGLIAGGVLVGGIVAVAAGQTLNLNDGIKAALQSADWGAVSGALILGLVVGLPVALRYGGADVIQHVILRWVLKKTRMVRPGLVRFLDKAVSNTLLRRAGSGYEFIVTSRLLRDFFERQYPAVFMSLYDMPYPVPEPPAPVDAPTRASFWKRLLRPLGDFLSWTPSTPETDAESKNSPPNAKSPPDTEIPPNAKSSSDERALSPREVPSAPRAV